MDVPMDTTDPGSGHLTSVAMSDQAKTLAKMDEFDKIFEQLKQITLTQVQQNEVLNSLQEISSTFEVSLIVPVRSFHLF